MGVRWEQLDARTRRLVRARAAELPAVQRPTTRAPRAPLGPAGWLRCATCGQRTTVWAEAERHAHETGHHRIECELPQGAKVPPPDYPEGAP